MNGLPLMNLESLPVDARALIYFHIRSTEQELTGKVSDDLNIPYVRFREKTFSELAVSGVEIRVATNKFGGMCRLFDTSYCLTAIYNSIEENSQRSMVRQLLWKFIDELEFDMRIDSDWAYNYKWNLVNKIIKDKLFG